MKNAGEYARRVKKLLGVLRKEPAHKFKTEVPDDPLELLLIAILSRAASEHRAAAGLAALREAAVDLNEMRVTPVAEMVETLGVDFPQARTAAESLSRAINSIFNKTHTISLAHVKPMGVKVAGSYLSNLDGIDPHARALVILRCIKGHAVPLDDNMLGYLRRCGCIPPETSAEEAQAFLERQVKPADAEWFYHTFKRYAATHAGRPDRPAKAVHAVALKAHDEGHGHSQGRGISARKPAQSRSSRTGSRPLSAARMGSTRTESRRKSARPKAERRR